jgi:hypothetical protein
VAIWCWLAPEGVLKSFQGIEKLVEWHKAVSQLPEFQSEANRIKSLSFVALQQMNKFGGNLHLAGSKAVTAISEAPISDTVTPEELLQAKENFVFSNAAAGKKEVPKVM